ncbi:MAG: NADP-dependent isocitrate dehydrogenase [Rhodospirillales bacterium]|jgi:isocitrate dehydrogenase|nr:NADP-dependent isocitrate dehydrogenase [Rhodospirillales bacterium]
MKRLKVSGPIVELDGDEMARVMWGWVRDELILPYLDIDLITFDLSVTNRDATDDVVTAEAARAVKEHHVGVKCAAINPDQARVAEFGLKKAWKSPNAQVRKIIGGTLFRAPVICQNIPRRVPGWTRPIVIARHSFSDRATATDFKVPGEGTLSIKFTPAVGGPDVEHNVVDFDGPGIAVAMYNTDALIGDFARTVMVYALNAGLPLYLGTKNTVLEAFHGRFKEIFAQIYETEFKANFKAGGLSYEHRLIDDMAGFAMKSGGGFVWACMNHDGDVQADAVAEGFGSLGLMTSVLMTADGGTVQTEAAHGTITRHYREHQAGRETSTNPAATILAWAGALAARARLDNTPEIAAFAQFLHQACIQTIESGQMTKDLARRIASDHPHLTTREFLTVVAQKLDRYIAHDPT